jgi:hypothetical protein
MSGGGVDIMMPTNYHHDVRTTLTLDDDVASKLKSLSRRTGRAFKDVVNETLRRGLAASAPSSQPREPFRVRARPLGLRPGMNLDCIAELLERIEGPLHR